MSEFLEKFRSSGDLEKTPEMCQLAVKTEPRCLRYVPEGFKTSEMCELAVEKLPVLIAVVPEHLRSESMCLRVIEKLGAYTNYVSFIPKHLQTVDFFKKVLKVCPRSFHYFPEEFRVATQSYLA